MLLPYLLSKVRDRINKSIKASPTSPYTRFCKRSKLTFPKIASPNCQNLACFMHITIYSPVACYQFPMVFLLLRQFTLHVTAMSSHLIYGNSIASSAHAESGDCAFSIATSH